MSEKQVRITLTEISKRTYTRGLVKGSGGNVSVRQDASHILITPSGVSLGDTTPENIVKLNLYDETWSAQGEYVPSKEFRFHKAIYKVRSDISAIVHCHPPHATAYAVQKRKIPYVTDAAFKQPPMPRVPFAPSGSDELARRVEEAATEGGLFRVMLLEEHGIVSVGRDLVEAFIFAELAEEMAQIAFLSALLSAEQLSDQVK